MDTQSEKISFPGTSPLVAEDIRVYEANMANDVLRVNRLQPASERLAQAGIIEFLRSSQLDFHRKDLEPPVDAELMQATAEDFIFRTTGIEVNAPITWQEDLGMFDAHYDSQENSVAIIERDYATEYMRYMQLTSVAVHEKAHETGFRTRKAFTVRVPQGGGDYENYIRTSFGLSKTKILPNENAPDISYQGQFFEEAFAEETATRWKEEAISGHKEFGKMRWDTCWGVELPRRYHNYSHDISHFGPVRSNANVPAIAAYGLDLLSTHLGADLYQIIVDSRHEETEVSAKQRFIQTINELQPGLYQKLRGVAYTPDGFKEGLRIIQEVTGQ